MKTLQAQAYTLYTRFLAESIQPGTCPIRRSRLVRLLPLLQQRYERRRDKFAHFAIAHKTHQIALEVEAELNQAELNKLEGGLARPLVIPPSPPLQRTPTSHHLDCFCTDCLDFLSDIRGAW